MRQIFLVCLLALAWAAPSQAAQDGPDPRRTRDRFAAYLERKPFHEQAFTRLVEAAAASDGVAALRADYAQRAAAEGAQPATRIVLARLLARDGELAEALELLAQLKSQGATMDVLRGRLLLAADRPQEAADVLAPAAADPAALDRRLAEQLYGLLAQAHLATGERDAAAAALRAQGALDPDSFELALEIADALAQAGLQRVALEEFTRAADLAGQDSERLCRVLSRSGRLHERRTEYDLAIADYKAALGRLRRGHWLERELAARLGRTHAAAGSLPAYADDLAARIAEHPGDLGLRERLFRAKLDMHDPEGAREVLAEATRAHPGDLALGRMYSQHLDRQGRDAERAVELQRILAEHPGEMDLYLDLGRLLAREGKLDQARRQWERSLAQRVGDVGFVLRLAQLLDRYGMSAEAAELVERAITAEPEVLSHYAELGGLALRAGDRAGVSRVLERAAVVAGEEPARLEELASIARGLRRKDSARAYMEKAVLLDPEDAHLWRLLATVAMEQRDGARAAEALRKVLSVADQASLRREALSQLVRRAQMGGGLESLIVAELEAAVAGESVSVLIVARAYRKQNRGKQALEILEALEDGGDLATEELADTLEDLGRIEDAVALYERLAKERPARQVSYLREIVRLEQGEGNKPQAAAAVERILLASPNLPAVWRDAARSFDRLKMGERALEVMQRAVDLDPSDGALRLAHAEMLLENKQLERAIAAARVAAQSEDTDLADSARSWLHKRLVVRGGVEAEMARLRAVLAANPYDDNSALALIDLFERELEYSLALDLIGELLSARPQAVQLLDLRAQLLGEMGRWEASLEDLERLKRLEALDPVHLAGREARAALALGQRERAERALARMPARRAAAAYEEAGLEDEALACLETERVRHPEDLGILQALLRVHRARGNRSEAEALLEELLVTDGESADACIARGDLAFEFRDNAAGIDWYARSLALATPETIPAGMSQRESRRAKRRLDSEFSKRINSLQTKLQGHDLWYASFDVLIQATRLRPDNPMLLTRALGSYSMGSRGAELLELLEFVRAETLVKGKLPAGISADKWESDLEAMERGLIRRYSELATERSAELHDVQALSEVELKEAFSLARDQSDDEQLRRVADEMLARSPDDRRAWALLVELDLDSNDEEAAEAGMRKLLEMKTYVRARAKLQALPRVPRKHQSREQEKLPESLREAFTKEVALQHYYLGRTTRWSVGWGRVTSPNVGSVLASLGFLLAEQGREAEAREFLAELAPAHPYMLAQSAQLAKLYRDLEWKQESEALEAQVRELVLSVLASPVLRSGLKISPDLVALMQTPEALAAGATVTDRYRHERLWVGPDGAYRSRLASVEGDAIRAQLKADWELALGQDLPFGDLRVAGVLYAEALVLQEAWEALGAVIAGLELGLASAPAAGPTQARFQRLDWLELRELRSRVLCEQGRLQEAVALLRKDIEAADAELEAGKKVVPQRNMGFDSGEPEPMDPRRPSWFEVDVKVHTDLVRFAQSLDQGIDITARRSGTKVGVPVDLPLRALLFNLLARSSMHVEALACFTEMVQANSGILSWLEYPLSRALRTDELKGSALGFVGLLYKQSTSNQSRLLSYGKQLVDADRSKEAEALYKAYLANGTRDSERVESALEKLRPKVVMDLATAEAQVLSDPRNMGLRRDLAGQLFKKGRYASGAVHALEASVLGPHLAELRMLGIGSLLVLGRDAEWETAVRKDLARGDLRKSQIASAVHLGARLWQRGEEQAAVEWFAGLARTMNWSLQTSFTHFFELRGRMDLAADQLALEVKTIGAIQPWIQGQLKEQLCQVLLKSGRGLEAMEMLVEKELRDKEGQALEDRLKGFESLLESRPGQAERVAAMREYLAQHEGRTARLCSLAIELVEGNWKVSEPLLMELGLASTQSRGLCLRAVASAREREDWAAAADYLGQIEQRFAPSRRRKVGSEEEYTERQVMDLEMGEYLIRLGDLEAGLARWERASRGVPEGQAGRLAIERLALVGRQAEALERWSLQEAAGSELPTMELKAALQAQAGDRSGALQTLLEVLHGGAAAKDQLDPHLLAGIRQLVESLESEGVEVDLTLDMQADAKALEGLSWLESEDRLWREGLASLDELRSLPEGPIGLRLQLLEFSILDAWRKGDQEALPRHLEELRELELEEQLSPRKSWSWRASLLVDAGNKDAATELLKAVDAARDPDRTLSNLSNMMLQYGLKDRPKPSTGDLEKALTRGLAHGPLSKASDPSSRLRKLMQAEPVNMGLERERYTASDAGLEARLRFGAACYGGSELTEAVELLRTVLAQDSDRLAARWILLAALSELGDTAGALQTVEEITDYVRRVAQVDSNKGRVRGLIERAHFRAVMKHQGIDAAAQWIAEHRMEPFALLEAYDYQLSYVNRGRSVGGYAQQQARDHGLWAFAAGKPGMNFDCQARRHWLTWRLGQREEAWKSLVADVRSGAFDSTGDFDLLLRLGREGEYLEGLRAELLAGQSAEDGPNGDEFLLLRLAQAAEDWPGVMELLGAPPLEESVAYGRLRVRALRELGRHEEAFAYVDAQPRGAWLARLKRGSSSLPWFDKLGSGLSQRFDFGEVDSSSTMVFRSGSFALSSASTPLYSRPVESTTPDTWEVARMVLARETGRVELADRLEERFLVAHVSRAPAEALRAIIRAYLKEGLQEYAGELNELLRELSPKLGESMLEELARAAEDSSARLERIRAEGEQDKHGAMRLRMTARSLIVNGGAQELPQVRRWLQRAEALETAPEDRTTRETEGWIALAEGDEAAARQAFRRAYELARLAGWRNFEPPTDLVAGLALARGAVDGPGTAEVDSSEQLRAVLRALARLSESPLRARLEARRDALRP